MRRATFLLALLLVVPAGLRGQLISEPEAAVFVGCYEVEVGEWSVEVAPETASDIPARLELGRPFAPGESSAGGHVRMIPDYRGDATARAMSGERLGSWWWTTRNGRSVHVSSTIIPGWAIGGVRRDSGVIEGRVWPAGSTLEETRRTDFESAKVALVPVDCAPDP